jgi:copper homeostasis protein
MIVEVCVESLESALLAEATGCHRIELCSHLAVGGTTPSIELVEATLKSVKVPVVALIRNRPGDFVYSASDKAAMIAEVGRCVGAGVSGIAIGALQNDDRRDLCWDLPFMRQIADLVRNINPDCSLVCHRAIDDVLTAIPVDDSRLKEILDPLIELGFGRILTSGGYPYALQGAKNIRRMIDHADGRIEILPGGGVTPQNVLQILSATTANQIHGSFQLLPSGKQVNVDPARLSSALHAIASSDFS